MPLIHYAPKGSSALKLLTHLTPLMPQEGINDASVNELLAMAGVRVNEKFTNAREAIASMEQHHKLTLHLLEQGYYYELEDALESLIVFNGWLHESPFRKSKPVPYKASREQLGLADNELAAHAEKIIRFVDMPNDLQATSAFLMIETANKLDAMFKKRKFSDTLSPSLISKVMYLKHLNRQAHFTGKLELDLETVVPLLGVIAAISTEESGDYIEFTEESGIIQTVKGDLALWKLVNELDLSVRTANILENAAIKYVGQLVQRTEADFLRLKNSSRKSLKEIKEILAEEGLALGMKPEGWTIDGTPPPRPR